MRHRKDKENESDEQGGNEGQRTHAPVCRESEPRSSRFVEGGSAAIERATAFDMDIIVRQTPGPKGPPGSTGVGEMAVVCTASGRDQYNLRRLRGEGLCASRNAGKGEGGTCRKVMRKSSRIGVWAR